MSDIKHIVLVQPPFVQLNSPYPAPYYLKNFLETRFGKKKGFRVIALDHSIGLFEKIFCRTGLERIFHDAEKNLQTKSGTSLPRNDKHTVRVIERFLSEKKLWVASIDRLIAFLRGRDPEWGHFLALANGCIPGGPRVDTFIAAKGGEVSPDDTKLLATMLLSDMADFITCTLDSGFSLVRYMPVVKNSDSGYRDFSAVKKSLDGYIMNAFYRPMLNEEWEKLEKNAILAANKNSPFLLGLTIPFPGCLSAALVCAESAKKHFSSAVRTIAGGGYINTELRFTESPGFSDYFDYVSLDRGYSFLAFILEQNKKPLGKNPAQNFAASLSLGKNFAIDAALEDEAARTVFPDYSGVDFSRYLYPVDDANPMHRLWSDGHWLKAYLAHGCYWHSCAFCDVTLDYIKNFIPVDASALFAHLKNQAEKTGVRGVHFVDEAAPLSSLTQFALLNREAGLPLNFWSNIRFEKDFTPDAAAILAAGGLVGVSAGLEVATERGVKRLGKGITLESVVSACAAFKEAGILTHAYLIYGYWDEDEQEIIDSAEISRQFFALGLLDSAFWHKFVLTRHSRIYAEKQRGQHPKLTIKDDPGNALGGVFALNDLSFEGEEKYDKYTEPLETLLSMWTRGNTETPVTKAFPFKVKSPSVPSDFVENLLGNYMSGRDSEKKVLPEKKRGAGINNLALKGRGMLFSNGDGLGLNTLEERPEVEPKVRRGIKPSPRITDNNVLFLGSIPRISRKGKNIFLRWRWRLEERELETHSLDEAEKLSGLLETVSTGNGLTVGEFYPSLEKIVGTDRAKTIWIILRENGLAIYLS